MPTLEQIRDSLKRVDGISGFLGRKEIKELPSILWEDELPETLVQGNYNNSIGVLFATNKRLLFVDKGMLGGLKVEDFPYDKITSIQYETGILMGRLTIFASGNRAEITQCDKKLVRAFGEFVRARTSGSLESKAPTKQASSMPANSATSDNTNDVLTQLERLAKLRDQGILSGHELEEQKAKLLARL